MHIEEEVIWIRSYLIQKPLQIAVSQIQGRNLIRIGAVEVGQPVVIVTQGDVLIREVELVGQFEDVTVERHTTSRRDVTAGTGYMLITHTHCIAVKHDHGLYTLHAVCCSVCPHCTQHTVNIYIYSIWLTLLSRAIKG